LYAQLYIQAIVSRTATNKALLTSPTTSSIPSEGSPLSDPESDDEVGFYTDEDDDEDGETGFSDGNILNSDEDITYESLVSRVMIRSTYL